MRSSKSHASLLLPRHLALKLYFDTLDLFPHMGWVVPKVLWDSQGPGLPLSVFRCLLLCLSTH